MGTLKVDGHIEGNYIKANWLYTASATEKSSADKIACIGSDNYIYYVAPFNLRAGYIRDSYDGSNITITYAKSGQSSTSWLASWNGYELGAISPGLLSVNYANSAGTASNSDTVDGYHATNFVKATGVVSTPNSVYDTCISMIQQGSNYPSGSPYGVFLTMPYRKAFGNTIPDFAGQIFIPNGDDSTTPDGLYYRTAVSTSWRNWKSVIHSCSATYFGATLPSSGMNTGDVFFKT